MLKRHVLAVALAAAFAAGTVPPGVVRAAPPATLSPEDQALVDKAAAYLDSLGEAKGTFVQTDGRGNVSRGEIYLDRPGKARLEYKAPSSLLIVADGKKVAVYNPRLQTFNSYPLGSTPLSLFLQKNVRLDQKVVVSNVQRFPGGFRLTATDGRHQTLGQITLDFWDAPMTLKQWSIVDAQRARTVVQINDLHATSGLDPSLFELKAPRPPVG